MALKPKDILEIIDDSLSIADFEAASGFSDEELELKEDELIIRPKDTKRLFRVRVEMFYEDEK